MILDQHGKPITPIFTFLTIENLDKAFKAAFRVGDHFTHILDERGRPIVISGKKIGDTVEVKRPARFSA